MLTFVDCAANGSKQPILLKLQIAKPLAKEGNWTCTAIATQATSSGHLVLEIRRQNIEKNPNYIENSGQDMDEFCGFHDGDQYTSQRGQTSLRKNLTAFLR